jgi:molybdenum cofactor cytidylyltransferase
MAQAGEIVGILLAAGSGSRFGADKLLYPLADGTPMAVAAGRRLRGCCERTIAVLRPGTDRLAELLAAEGVATVVSTESVYGMGHSLAAGVRATAEAAGWIIALADMPFIEPASYQCVKTALRKGASIAAPAHDGRRGHPVGFSVGWFDTLSRLGGDEGARSILAAAPEHAVLCPVDDQGIHRDVDTRADLGDYKVESRYSYGRQDPPSASL